MKKFLVGVMCFLCLGVSFSFGYDAADLIEALNKTYQVNGDDFKLPASIRNKVVNYINTKNVTEEQCESLMGILDEAIDFANDVGTTNISELSADELKTGMALVNDAASVLKMEVKVNSTLDKVVATEKDTGKIVEEVEQKDAFFKSTGGERDFGFWCCVALGGLVLVIVAYVLLVKFVKWPYIDFICNTVLLLYVVCAMPLICFGSYIEILDLLKPILSSENGEGYIDIVDVEIKGPQGSSDTTTTPGNIKYPVLGEMYAKLKIPSCDIALSVYYGDNEKILDVGVGHFSGSHFPGQGKGILYTTHNTPDKLYNLKDIKVGDAVSVLTNFGEFSYKVTETKVIKDTDESKAYIESDKEVLMIYTCYPFDSEGYTDERFMVYCERSEV